MRRRVAAVACCAAALVLAFVGWGEPLSGVHLLAGVLAVVGIVLAD